MDQSKMFFFISSKKQTLNGLYFTQKFKKRKQCSTSVQNENIHSKQLTM